MMLMVLAVALIAYVNNPIAYLIGTAIMVVEAFRTAKRIARKCR